MYKEIQSQFNEILRYSQGIDASLDIHTDELFKDWYENKEWFIKKFKGLIYEVPEEITVTLPSSEKTHMVNDFVFQLKEEFQNIELADFVKDNEEGFFDNKVVKANPQLNIPEGMKLIKAFKKFEQDKTVVKDIENLASMIIQENRLTGKLCFSVHPFDFLSISENNHKWRSCHSLDGEYRAGNLSLMVDPCSFIVYLKSNREEKLTMFPEHIKWNSKKWRTLFFLSTERDLLFASKEYPFSVGENLLDIVKEHLGKALFNRTLCFSSWTKDLIYDYKIGKSTSPLNGFGYLGVGGKLRSLESVVIDKSNLHYNDLLYSTSYSPMWCYLGTDACYDCVNAFIPCVSSSDNNKIMVGGPVACILCEEEPIFSGGSTMFCKECEINYGECSSDDFAVCSSCGDIVFIEDCILSTHGDLYCESCAEELLATCEHCGRVVLKKEMCYDEESDLYVCQYCQD